MFWDRELENATRISRENNPNLRLQEELPIESASKRSSFMWGGRKESVLVGVYLRQAVGTKSSENECEAEDIEMWSVRAERKEARVVSRVQKDL